MLYFAVGRKGRGKQRTSKETTPDCPVKQTQEIRAGKIHHHRTLFHLSILILLGFLAYSNTFQVPFHFDDLANIVENTRIRNISNILSFFTHFEGQPIMARPLTAATFAVNYYFGGLDTTGYHIFNLALHIANGILLYFLIKITAGLLNYRDDKITRLIALFSSLIFTVHPIQTESVTYIVSRSVLLSAFFFLLGTILFTKAVGSEGKKRIVYTTALFITSLLGMASREEFFIFPLMLILYDLFFVSRQGLRGVIRNYRLHLSAIATLGYVIFIVLNFDYGEHAGYGVKTITPLKYLLTQFNVHWTYIRLLLLPINQILDYNFPAARTIFEIPTILSFIGYLGLWAIGINLYRKRRLVSFCLLSFLIALLPSSSLIPILDYIFEHRLYLPSIFLISIVITLVSTFSVRLRLKTGAGRVLLSVPVLIFAVLVYSTFARNAVWGSTFSLLQDTVSKSPGKGRPHANLGIYYAEQGRFTKAERELQTALKLDPRSAEAHYNLGNVYYIQNQLQAALEHFQTAIDLEPGFAKAHANLGAVYEQQGETDKAEEEYRRAINYNPFFTEAHVNLATLLYKQKRLDEAFREFQLIIDSGSDSPDIHYNLGNIYFDRGLLKEAIKQYQTALRLNPAFADAYYNLGNAYFDREQMQPALEAYRNVIRLRPDFAEAYNNLGAVYSTMGWKNEAWDAYQTALKLKPDYAPARNNLRILQKKLQ